MARKGSSGTWSPTPSLSLSIPFCPRPWRSLFSTRLVFLLHSGGGLTMYTVKGKGNKTQGKLGLFCIFWYCTLQEASVRTGVADARAVILPLCGSLSLSLPNSLSEYTVPAQPLGSPHESLVSLQRCPFFFIPSEITQVSDG